MDRTHRLLSLRPRNGAAYEVLNHPCNADLVSQIMMEKGLDIGHFKSNATHDNECCIATLGRHANADIVVPKEWKFVSEFQCNFLVSNNTCVKFVDTSTNVSCQAYKDENSDEGLLSHDSRQADNSNGLCRISFQIAPSESAEFDIIWRFGRGLASALEARRNAVLSRRPRAMGDTQILPATDPEPESQQLSSCTADTRSIDGALSQDRVRPLGRGAFGAVYVTRNPETKQFYARKEQRYTEQARREIDTFIRLGRHANIVKFQGHEIDEQIDRVYISMDLMEGSLHDMVEKKNCPVQLDENHLAKVVYHHVLMGLDYIHSKGFVHRDLKPANILWAVKNGDLSFCIADFGFCNRQSQVKTVCYTFKFQAPEFQFDYPQTTAIDLWSLFITLLWTANLGGFRNLECPTYSEMLVWVASLARRRWEDMALVQELVVLDPRDRATASQMLVKNFGGNGLTTRLEDVPRLQTVTAPEQKKKAATGEAIWLYQLVRPGDMTAQESIDENAPGNHIFERPVLWPANKKKNVQVDDENFGGGGGIVVAPKGKAFKNYPISPVAKQLWATKQRALAIRRPVIREADVRGIRFQAKGPSAAEPWFGQLQQTPGLFPSLGRC